MQDMQTVRLTRKGYFKVKIFQIDPTENSDAVS